MAPPSTSADKDRDESPCHKKRRSESNDVQSQEERRHDLRKRLMQLWTPLKNVLAVSQPLSHTLNYSSKEQFEEFFEFLLKHPELAKEQFEVQSTLYHGETVPKLPLSLIVSAARSTVEHVKAIYNLYPAAIKDGPPRSLPIYSALARGQLPDILEFLIRTYPDCLRKAWNVNDVTNNRDLPIHVILNWKGGGHVESDEDVKVIELCLDLYPECMSIKNSFDQIPLVIATAGNLPRATDLILKRMPKDIDSIEFGIDHHRAQSVMLAIDALTRLLPQLRRVQCPRVASDAFLRLMDTLTKGDTSNLEVLKFQLQCGSLEVGLDLDENLAGFGVSPSQQSRMKYALEAMVASCDLSELRLCMWGEYDSNIDDDEVMNSIVRGIGSAKQRLSLLELDNFLLTKPNALGRLLATPQCPRAISLRNLSLRGGSWNLSCTHNLTSFVESLEIHGLSEADEDSSLGFYRLLENMDAHTKCLEDFYLGFYQFLSSSCPVLRNLVIREGDEGDDDDRLTDGDPEVDDEEELEGSDGAHEDAEGSDRVGDDDDAVGDRVPEDGDSDEEEEEGENDPEGAESCDFTISKSIIALMEHGVIERLNIRHSIQLTSLIDVIQRNACPSLNELRVRNPCPSLNELRVRENDTDTDFQALVEAVERHNTTLEVIEVGIHARIDRKHKLRLKYLTCLNKYGRGAARNPNTSRSSFVDLLVRIATTAESDSDRLFSQLNVKDPTHAVLYDILCQNPTLWSEY